MYLVFVSHKFSANGIWLFIPKKDQPIKYNLLGRHLTALCIPIHIYLSFISVIKYFLKSKATVDVPIKVAVQYSHKFVITPDNTAGARERAGFIEAPDMNAKKNMSRPTIPPITIPLKPLKPLVYITTRITVIKSPEASISMLNMKGKGKE